MKLNDFIGNKNKVQFLYNRLLDFYRGTRETNYIIIIGNSGNGKTLLAELLAKELKAELFRIQPFLIESNDDLNNFIKSVNIDSLDYKRKLILIDDIDDFHFIYKKGLLSIPEISRFPVIFTSKDFNFSREMKSGSLRTSDNKWFFKLNKPRTSLLKKHLMEEKSDLSEEEIEKIARESKSVRSAILSLRSSTVNRLVSLKQTKWEIINSIRERKLKAPLTRKNFHWIFDSIQGCGNGSMKDLDDVMQKFSQFHYRIYVKHETYGDKMIKEGIDPFFINNMIEPVEKILWEYKQRKIESKVKKEPKKEESEIPKINLVTPLEKWGI